MLTLNVAVDTILIVSFEAWLNLAVCSNPSDRLDLAVMVPFGEADEGYHQTPDQQQMTSCGLFP